jgi:signal transduction histidine kinase
MPARLRRRWRSRLAVIAALVGFVVIVYVVVVLAGGALIGHAASPSVALSVLATVIVALLFSRVQTGVEQLVARSIHDGATNPYEVLSRFSENLTAADTTHQLPARMARLLGAGTGAQWAQVWLVVSDRLVLAATWPAAVGADTEPPAPPPPDAGDSLSGRRSLPVIHGGQTLGMLTLQERPGLPLTAVEQRLFSGLAGQAGSVLRGVALDAALRERRNELLTQAATLRASRQRVIDAQDTERRRLERDMHDGAQQHLVALAVNLRVAQTVAQRSPRRAVEVLRAQARAAEQTIATLTSLSRGIYPRLLTDEGLMVALGAALTGSPVPVTVDPPDPELSNPPPLVEAALYFCALEALQNAAKHSDAGHVTVRVAQHPDCWTLAVQDDGRGFDARDSLLTASAGGLLNMEDRLAAVGGTMHVNSRPGEGTTVTACAPRGSVLS